MTSLVDYQVNSVVACIYVLHGPKVQRQPRKTRDFSLNSASSCRKRKPGERRWFLECHQKSPTLSSCSWAAFYVEEVIKLSLTWLDSSEDDLNQGLIQGPQDARRRLEVGQMSSWRHNSLILGSICISGLVRWCRIPRSLGPEPPVSMMPNTPQPPYWGRLFVI